MSELRLFLRRDSLLEGTDCAWALLDDAGHLQGSGNQLVDLPRSRRCRLVLASDLVMTLKAPLPDLPERRLAPLLPAVAEASTLAESDTIHAVVMERAKEGEAILAVVEEAWLSRVLSRLAGLGLHPESALPEYLLLPWTEGNWSVCWRGKHPMARFGRCEGMPLDEGEPPVGLILAKAHRGQPEAVTVFTGENAGLFDRDRWQKALAVRVETHGPWEWRSAPWPDLPNLLQGAFAPGLKRMDWTRLARPVAWGAATSYAFRLPRPVLSTMISSRKMRMISRYSSGGRSSILARKYSFTRRSPSTTPAFRFSAARRSVVASTSFQVISSVFFPRYLATAFCR